MYILNNISNSKNDDIKNYADYFPHFLWVLRDFSLELNDDTPKYLFIYNISKLWSKETI